MTFRQSYQQALTLQADTLPESLPESTYFAGLFYELCEAAAGQLPTVLSGGSLEIASSLTLSFQPLDCRMLLYTKEGSGCLSIHGASHTLQTGSLLYLDCSQAPFSLKADQRPWRYIVFSLRGGLFPVYESLAPFETFLLAQPDPHGTLLRNIRQLLSGNTDNDLRNKLRDAGLITAIMTELFSDLLPAGEVKEDCAPYLLELRHYLDHYYREPLLLSDLEARYHISKYHICRSFSAAFGIPPL